ncbi:MAG: helix-turn-helix domain-containing protein [Thermomicrobium sp.]|nr:helix-turn-helix domain-containing protein [Thermomicrobium sp.]MDW7981855.1 helix-turn-helix domain-containing protein [Thermomicrobium sp.]
MIEIDGEEYLTASEAAALLGVKRETLYAYASRGRLRSYRRGIRRERLYRRSDIEALLRLEPASGERLRDRLPEAATWIPFTS